MANSKNSPDIPTKKTRSPYNAGRDGLPNWWHRYFAAIARNRGFKGLAAEQVGIDRKTPAKYLALHPELVERFEEEMADALDAANESLMQEVVRRGGPGFEEPVIYQGRQMWVSCLGSGLAVGAGEACPYCAVNLTPTASNALPEHPMLDGDRRPVPLTVKRHSDTLLMFTLNARGKGTRNNTYSIDLSKMSTEQLQRLAAGEDPLDVLAGGKS